MTTAPEQRAIQLDCAHPGHAIAHVGLYHMRCNICRVIVPKGDVLMVVRGTCHYGESAIPRAAVESTHEAEDYHEAEAAYLLEQYGYEPVRGNAPSGLPAIKYAFRRGWLERRLEEKRRTERSPVT